MASSGKNWSSTTNNADVPLTDISISKNSERNKDDENRNSSPSDVGNRGKDAADRLIVPSYDPVSNMALDPSVCWSKNLCCRFFFYLFICRVEFLIIAGYTLVSIAT